MDAGILAIHLKWWRAEQGVARVVVGRSKIPIKRIEDLLASSCFGEAWFQLESHSPALRKLPVFTRELPQQMRMAQTILETLDCQNFRRAHGPADRGDSPESAADQLV